MHYLLDFSIKEKEVERQFQKSLEKSKKDDFSSFPLNFPLYFERDLFSNGLHTKFPSANLYYESKAVIPNQRERYRTHLIGKIAGLKVPGKDHLTCYILYKFRNNCKPNTIRSALTGAVLFLKFIQKHSHRELEILKRSDIEAFVEFEQDRGMSAETLCTRLIRLYAFIRFLADEGVMSRELEAAI